MSSKNKQSANEQRHAFLLTFFDDKEEKYAFKEVNGFVLVRQWNGLTKRWEVAIWTKEKWSNAQNYREETQATNGRLEYLLADDGWKPPTLDDIKAIGDKSPTNNVGLLK